MTTTHKKIYLFSLSFIIWIGLFLNLEEITNLVVFSLLGLIPKTHFTNSIWFFLFEVPKVLLLLLIIVFFVGILRSYLSPEKIKNILEGKRLFTGNIFASLFGIITPFCSCSAIPLFLGFVESGIPLGATFSFLIAAPLINEVAVVLLFGLFGWQIAMLYVITGITLAIFSGFLIGNLKLEKYVEEWVYKIKVDKTNQVKTEHTFNTRLEYASIVVIDTISKVWLYIILGIAVGAGIHGYVPQNFLADLMGKSAWWSVPFAVIIGVPLYSGATGIIPVVQALLGKGAALGTVLAFMMSVIGLSFPEIIILKKVLKLQLIAIFVSIVTFGIILIGYLFNIIF